MFIFVFVTFLGHARFIRYARTVVDVRWDNYDFMDSDLFLRARDGRKNSGGNTIGTEE